jgi:hypothetical protein
MFLASIFPVGCLEILVRLTIAVVVDVITSLQSGLGTLAEPAGRPEALSSPRAAPEGVVVGAFLGVGKRIVDESIAVIILAVARFLRGTRGIARPPSRRSATGLETKAEPHVVDRGARTL